MSIFWEQDFEGLLYSPDVEFQVAVECAIEKYNEVLQAPQKKTRVRGADRGRLCKHEIKTYLCKLGCAHEAKKCKHGSPKYRCTICSPHLKCEHEAIKSICLLCNPKNCKHMASRHRCKRCSPHLTCEHEIIKSLCKLCNTIVYCQHGRRRVACKVCDTNELKNAANIIKNALHNDIKVRKRVYKK